MSTLFKYPITEKGGLNYTDFISPTVSKLIVVIVLYLFLPLTALTYYFFRQHRRASEVERILEILKIVPSYREAYYDKKPGFDFILAVFYASVISVIGMTLLFLGTEIRFSEFPSVNIGNVLFPQQGSRLVFSMAFLGAYLWGLQHVFRRYSMNDLTPSVYYKLSIRMVFAAVIALVIYNAYAALAGSSDSTSGITSSIWPALAFLIGMFPQRGLRWLTDRLPIFSSKTDPSVREIPLEMIEGIEIHDKFRLEELGIETCYDLATADFVPLILKTPYGARELIDWILQAKLCVYFGEAVKDLRQNSIRTIIDLEALKDERQIVEVATRTAVTKYALERARESVEKDDELKRLRSVGQKLGKFSEIKDELAAPSI